MSDVKARMQAWVSSANCWCDKEDKAYCTVCEIMIDALEEIEYLEGLLKKKIEEIYDSQVRIEMASEDRERESRPGHTPEQGASPETVSGH